MQHNDKRSQRTQIVGSFQFRIQASVGNYVKTHGRVTISQNERTVPIYRLSLYDLAAGLALHGLVLPQHLKT